MTIIATSIPSNWFDYEPKTKTFSTEASTISGMRFMGLAFDDACDQGFQIESVKTGRKVLFTFDHIDTSPEGECEGWWFTVYNPRNDPKLAGLRALVIND